MNWTIECGDRLYGVFKTADAAAKWAIHGLAPGSKWIIRPIEKPELS